jgi:lysophospholipase L1-like esterase
VAAVLAAGVAMTPLLARATPPMRFDFGPGPVQPGYAQVVPDTLYTPDRGYGFEPGEIVRSVDRSSADPLRGDFCTSDGPFYFSVAVPEGNYNVTVTLGDTGGESDTTIKAELRRLMLEKIHTSAGQFERRTFTVNVRTPAISTGGDVKLKGRERQGEMWNWDDRLTLEFNGRRPCVCAVEIEPAPDAPTVYLLGDSTVCDQPLEPWNSWGQMLPRFFKPGIAVANHAQSGESLRSSLGANRLAKVLSTMKKGDYLFIQYGHNDMKAKGEGVGPFTTYKKDLTHFVQEAKKKGATPVLVTSMERKAGVDKDTLGDYPEAVRQVAKEEDVPLIDLHAVSKTVYKALGADLGKAFQDGTHHNNYGSYELAKCVVEGIRQNKLDLARFIADDVPAFDPSKPDPVASFEMAPSAMSSTTKPLGN